MENISLLILTFIVLGLKPLRQHFFSRPKDQEATATGHRQIFFDFIKGLAILAVVIIHVQFIATGFYFYKYRYFLYTINLLARFAVPVFFICSGILLSSKAKTKSQWKHFYNKKIVRVFIPYILISVLTLLVTKVSLWHFPYAILTGKAQIPFYFIIILAQFYLLFPFLVKLKNKKWFLPTCFFISIITAWLPGLRYFQGFPIFLPQLFFFAYGLTHQNYFLNYNRRSSTRSHWWWLIIAGYVMIFFIFPEVYYNQRYFYALAFFNLLFIYQPQIIKSKKLVSLVSKAGKNSLWIYLLHFPIVVLLFFFIKFG